MIENNTKIRVGIKAYRTGTILIEEIVEVDNETDLDLALKQFQGFTGYPFIEIIK